MDSAIEFLKKLISIRSITEFEAQMTEVLEQEAKRLGFRTERFPVAPERENLLVTHGDPEIILTTHVDVVPGPDHLFTPREEEGRIIGRGAVDTKGITVSFLIAAERLLREGFTNFGLLWVVGEEVDGIGAKTAAKDLQGRGIQYLINGEPTEHRLASAHKGVVGVRLVATGKACHSGYPELGVDANRKLMQAAEKLYTADLGEDPLFGRATVNIGEFKGGLASNIVSPHAEAHVSIRSVLSMDETLTRARAAVGDICEVQLLYSGPCARMLTLPILETGVMSYFTDVPHFAPLGAEVLLYGPGTIHRAHTDFEYITRDEIVRAADDVVKIVHYLRNERPKSS